MLRTLIDQRLQSRSQLQSTSVKTGTIDKKYINNEKPKYIRLKVSKYYFNVEHDTIKLKLTHNNEHPIKSITEHTLNVFSTGKEGKYSLILIHYGKEVPLRRYVQNRLDQLQKFLKTINNLSEINDIKNTYLVLRFNNIKSDEWISLVQYLHLNNYRITYINNNNSGWVCGQIIGKYINWFNVMHDENGKYNHIIPLFKTMTILNTDRTRSRQEINLKNYIEPHYDALRPLNDPKSQLYIFRTIGKIIKIDHNFLNLPGVDINQNIIRNVNQFRLDLEQVKLKMEHMPEYYQDNYTRTLILVKLDRKLKPGCTRSKTTSIIQLVKLLDNNPTLYILGGWSLIGNTMYYTIYFYNNKLILSKFSKISQFSETLLDKFIRDLGGKII